MKCFMTAKYLEHLGGKFTKNYWIDINLRGEKYYYRALKYSTM